MAINQIGAFRFLTMSNEPMLKQKQLIIEARAGIDGYSAWLEASRGEPTPIFTAADTANYEQDRWNYVQSIGSVVPVIFDGVLVPGNFLILEVTPRKRSLLFGRQVIATSTPNAIISAQWTLVSHV